MNDSLDLTPAKLNYKMPPEWHYHSGTQLHWPSNRETWPGERLEYVEGVYLDIIEILHKYEPIHLFVENREVHNRTLNLFRERAFDLSSIIFHLQPINDVWARDCGPIFICRDIDGREDYAITDWEYNAWGEKYLPFKDDNRLAKYLASQYGVRRFEPKMVLEGGSIDTNGDGVLLTTESVLLNPNRNPNLSKDEIEQRLKGYLGVEKIIWLKEGLAGDDTDGHIDDIARFLNKHTILAMVTENRDNVNYDALQENLGILKQATDQHGNKFTIETLSLPKTHIEGTTADGSKFVPASYANFYIANGVVLVPTYEDPLDQKALELLKRYFTEREVVGIPSKDLVWGQGAIHCVTQQLYGI